MSQYSTNYQKVVLRKKVDLIAVQAPLDYIHMVSMLHLIVAQCMEVLKSKSGLTILDRHANLNDMREETWKRGYFVDIAE